MLKSKTGTWWFAAIVLGILVVAVFSPFIFSDKMLFSSDQMSGLDSKVYLKTSIEKYHQLPFWLNSRLGGMPTIDAMFGDAMYLPSIIINSLVDVPRAIGMKMIFHIFLAGLFFFLMLRKGFKLPPLIAMTGAIFYMFNPQFVSHIYPGHDGKMYVIAWLPFIIWHLKALMDRPGLLTMTLTGFGVGMSILTSHIQMTYFVLWGAFLYWLLSTYLTYFKFNDCKKTIAISCYFWAAILIGLGLGAVQLFPSFLYIRDGFSVRGVDRGFEFASSWSLNWPEFFSLWVPEFVNTLDYYWGQNPFKLNSEYAGMMPLLLALAAVVIKPKNPWRILWASIAVFTVLFALGAHTPVFHIAYAIVPGVKKFRAASMIMFWFSFSTILLSVLFLKDLASGVFQSLSEERRKKWSKGILIAGAASLALTLLFSVQGVTKGLFSSVLAEQGKERIFEVNFTRNFLPFLWMWLIFILTTLALLWGAVKNRIPASVCIAVILILGIIDIVRVDSGFIKLVNPAPYFHRDPALKPLVDAMKTEPFRCYALPGALPQNGEGIHGLEGLGGFHDNELHWYREFRGDRQDRNYLSSLVGMNADGQAYLRAEMLPQGNPFLNLANAKYMLVRNGNQLLTILNRNALNRLSFVQGYEVMDSSRIIEALAGGTLDYHRTVALTVKPDLPGGFNLQETSSFDTAFKTEWQTYSPNYRKAKVTAASDGFMRIAEVYYPGWEVRIDGKRTRCYRADLAWMATPITAGSHIVELLPHSNYLKPFTIISCVVFLFMAAIWIVYAIMGKMERREQKALSA